MQLHNILKILKFLPLIWGLKYEICCWLVSWVSLIGLWLYNIRTLCQIEDGSGHFEPLVSIGDLQSVQQSHDIRPLLLHTQLHPPPTLHWEQGTEESILIISAILLPPAFSHVRKISQDVCCSNTRESGTHKTLDHFTDLCSLSVKNLTQPHAWVGDLWVQITVQTSLWILVNITKCFESLWRILL